MRKNITTVIFIIMLFAVVFFLGNQQYLLKGNTQIIHNGTATITEAQLQEKAILQLDGQWSFYPNVLIAPDESMDAYEEQRLAIDVPSNW